MSNAYTMAEIARLVGEPARAHMLLALADGRALPAGELAACAGVAAQTASGHLALLERAGLVTAVRQGRHRYFRVASSEVAALLEATLLVASGTRPGALCPSRVDPLLQAGRTCYNHLAGRLGVALCDALRDAGRITLGEDTACVTESGLDLLARWGLDVAPLRHHPYGRTCIDWSERRAHLAGPLGRAIYRRCLALHWIEGHLDSRAVRVTPAGRQGFMRVFGLTLAQETKPRPPQDRQRPVE